jgi:hypothetical protein
MNKESEVCYRNSQPEAGGMEVWLTRFVYLLMYIGQFVALWYAVPMMLPSDLAGASHLMFALSQVALFAIYSIATQTVASHNYHHTN